MQIDYLTLPEGPLVWDIVRNTRSVGAIGAGVSLVSLTLPGGQGLWLIETCMDAFDPAGVVEVQLVEANPITAVITVLIDFGLGGGGLPAQRTVPYRLLFAKRNVGPWLISLQMTAAGAGLAAGGVIHSLLCLKLVGPIGSA
jgi:hypothetical protein